MNEFIDIFHSLIRQIPLLRYLHYVNVIAGPNMITVHMQLESSSDQSHINLLPLDAWIYIHVAYTLKFHIEISLDSMIWSYYRLKWSHYSWTRINHARVHAQKNVWERTVGWVIKRYCEAKYKANLLAA